MDLLLDVNMVLDICQPRPAFVQPALQVLSRARRNGDRLWLYVGSVQTLGCSITAGTSWGRRSPNWRRRWRSTWGYGTASPWHGGIRRHHHPLLGMNGRFDTLQAAVPLAKQTGTGSSQH